MASFTCPKCNGRGTTLQLVIDWNSKIVSSEPHVKICHMCEGTGIVDNEGRSRTW